MNSAPASRVQAPAKPAWYAWRPTLGTEKLAALASLFFLLAYNLRFWAMLAGDLHASVRLILSIALVCFSLHALLLGLVLTRWTAKPLLTALFLISACAVYYMSAYNVYLDADMIRNVLSTDRREATELLVPGLLPYVLLLGVLPSAVVWRLRLTERRWTRAIALRCGFLLAMFAVGVCGALLDFQALSSLMRNHREVRYLVTPANYLTSTSKVLFGGSARRGPLQPIGRDATQAPRVPGSKPRLLVFVLGETARAQNWGLDGYARQTTPELAALPGVINFPRATSCGTSTEVSLPCLFSPWGRHDYDEDRIRGHQSLLHVLDHAGVETLWRDNQSGCKGVCTGLPFESLADASDSALCSDKRCFDAILLRDLATRVAPDGRDRVVVLHQLGNHGPAYFLRYPPQLRRFTPTCDTEALGKCTRTQIVNSYDNALLYTDHMLAATIAFLKTQESAYDTAMIYVSDHGESLGEKGLFLHGVPYAIAPQEQTHVPMFIWLSPQFAREQGVDAACLRQRALQPASHDNLFPSILGLMQVRTRLYGRSRDLFAGCRQSGTVR